MTDITSGQQVEEMLLASLEALKQADVGPWIEMFHDHGAMEFPYAPPGNPTHLNGKAEIAGYMQGYPEHVCVRTVSLRGAYHSDGVMVVEFTMTGTAVPTGNAFIMEYVGIIQHNAGKIDHYRDYWNPLVVQQAMSVSDTQLTTDFTEKKS
jgi:uncharacterized protein